jgi:hypothetical protein
LLRNAQKLNKKNRITQPREKKNVKKKKKKAAFFSDEPRWTFSIFVFRVFELPLLRNARKTPLKNRQKIKIKIK